MAVSASDGDALARERDERPLPLFVLEGGCALELDLQSISKGSTQHTSRRTVVPSFRSVMSRVSPAGTVIPLRTMVEQEPLPEAAESASVKVHPESAEMAAVPAEATGAALTAADESAAA